MDKPIRRYKVEAVSYTHLNSQEVTRNDDAKGWSMSFYGNTLRIENHRRKGFNADFQAEELEKGLLPALLNPFKRRFGTYRNLLN